MELLIEQKIGGIPVVDEAEGLVGIVTYIDLLALLFEPNTGGLKMKNGKEGVVTDIMMGSPVNS